MSYKKKYLTIQEQYQVVVEMKSGVSKESIMEKYGISDQTYMRAINQGSLVQYEVKNDELGKKRSSKKADNTFLDPILLEWIKKARDRGDPISGPIIKEKALMFNKQLNGCETFRATTGWMDCFKRRYNIRFKGEKVCNDFSSAAEFSTILKQKIESEGLNVNNIYNADETGISWTLLKACTLPLYLEELEAFERKYKDRVTALFCTNATGSHRIPPLVIGTPETPQCLSNLMTKSTKDQRLNYFRNLGVVYTYQGKGLLDNNIFTLWYKDEFIPRVLEHQRISGITGKVLLLIENVLSPQSLNKLNMINTNFFVECFPPAETSLIQPMHQGLITTIEKLCKTNLLRSLLLSDKLEKPAMIQPTNEDLIAPTEKRHQISLLRQMTLSAKSEEASKFLRELNLRDFFSMLSIAWNDMKSPTIQKAWKPLLGELLNKELTSSNIQDPLSTDRVFKELKPLTDSLCFPFELCDPVSELLSKTDYSIEKAKEFLMKWFETNHNEKHFCWDFVSHSYVNTATNDGCEPEFITCDFESIIKIEKSEPVFENHEQEERTSIEEFQPESIIDVEKSEPVFEYPGSVESTSTWSCESGSVIKNNENEIFFKNLESLETASTELCEPESTIEIEKRRTLSENPKPEELTSSEALKCLVKLKKWLQCRTECLPKHLDYIKSLENLIMEHKSEKYI